MGSIYDRTREHLGTSDVGVIALHQRLLGAVRDVREGVDPPHLLRDPTANVFPRLDSTACVVDGPDWRVHFPLHLSEAPRVASEPG